MSAFTTRAAQSAAANVSHRTRHWLDIAARLKQELEVRRAARALDALDDALLRDVGITRGDIDFAVRHGRASKGT